MGEMRLFAEARKPLLEVHKALIASIDELADDKEFTRRYAQILQRSPDAALAHGRAAKVLRA